MAAITKNSKTNEIVISLEWVGLFGRNFVCSISGTLMLIDIKMKKKSLTELGHNGRLKIYGNPKKSLLTLALKSISPKRLGIFGHFFFWIISRTLFLIFIKMKNNCIN